MVELSGKKKLKLSLYIRLKGQGIFSLDINKILRLQVTRDARPAPCKECNQIHLSANIHAERQPESRFRVNSSFQFR